MAGYQTIRYEPGQGGVATITLDHPETRNALSNELLGELVSAFTAARDQYRSGSDQLPLS